MHRLLSLKDFEGKDLLTKDVKDELVNYWASLHFFWYKNSRFLTFSNKKMDAIVDSFQAGRINYLLAYMLYLARSHEDLRSKVNGIYEQNSTDAKVTSALMVVHYFAGVKTFDKSANEVNLLDKIYDNKYFANDVLSDIYNNRLDTDLLHSYFQAYIKVVNEDTVKYQGIHGNDPDVLEFVSQVDEKGGCNRYVIRISTGAIYLNNFALISRQDFTKQSIFATFFKADLEVAKRGRISNNFNEPVLEIENFQAQGANFRMVKGEVRSYYPLTYSYDIYRRISFSGDKYDYFYYEANELRDLDSLKSNLGLVNTSGLDAYTFQDESGLKKVAWMPRNSNNVVYFATVKKTVGTSMSITTNVTLDIPSLNLMNLELINAFQSDIFPSILRTFASKFPMSFFKKDADLIILIQTFVFAESSPLVFKIDSEQRIILLNDPNFVLHSDQVFNKAEPFAPMMILKNKNQPKSFVALIPDLDYNSTSNCIKVYKLEVNSEFTGLNLQTREEKLLLAYHNLYCWNFKAADKLLERDSIHHNSPFTEKEIALLIKITNLGNMSHPEGIAIMLMAAMHLKLDDVENMRNNAIESIFSVLIPRYFAYMREISHKYYVHLQFPEILNEDLVNVFKCMPRYIPKIYRPSDEMQTSMTLTHATSKETCSIYSYDTFTTETEFILENAISQLLYHLKNKGALKYLEGSVFKYEDNKQASIKQFDLGYWKLLFKLRQPIYNKTLSLAYCFMKGLEDAEFIKDVESERFWSKKDLLTATHTFEFTQCPRLVQDLLEETKKLKIPIQALTDSVLLSSRMGDDLKQKALLKNQGLDKKLRQEEVASKDDMKIFKALIEAIKSQWLEQKSSSHKILSTNFGGTVVSDLNTAIVQFGKDRTQLKIDEFKKSAVLETFLAHLNERVNSLTGKIAKHKAELENMAADPASSYTGTNTKTSTPLTLNFIDKKFHQKKDRTFESLYSCYFSNSTVCFENKFPHLGTSKIKELEEKTFTYYAESNLLNYFKLVTKMTTELNDLRKQDTAAPDAKSDIEIEILVKSLYDELEKLPEFNMRIKNPGILNFEFQSETVRLRQQQVNDVLSLTRKDKDNNNLPTSTVIQRMMAAGKTFVLGTLASVLKADGKVLSILVPPSSLYQTNALSMQERTLKYFKSRGKTFHFPRLNPSLKNENILFLKLVIDRINETIKNRDYLIMDPSDLSAFHNSFIEHFELLSVNPGSTVLRQILDLHAKIYDIFKTQTSIILDEIDMTMDPKLELNYPTQKTEKINLFAADLTADLLIFTAFDKEVQNNGLDILSNNQANFDQTKIGLIRENWQNYVQKQLGNKKSIWFKVLLRDGKDKFTVSDIVDFIFKPELPEKFAKVTKLNHKATYEILAILRMQVQRWIPESFNGSVFEKFGPSIANWNSIKYAIPYVSANTPNERSVFADRWETLNKTLLMYIVKPFTFEEISALALEILERDEDPTNQSINAFEDFAKIAQVAFSDIVFDSKNLIVTYKPTDLEKRFADKSKSKVLRLIFTYVIRKVMEPIDYYQEQITSNALNMTSMFSSVQGYSGTIDNINTLPRQLVSIAAQERLENEKNNGGIVAKLIDDNETVVVMNSIPVAAEAILEQALAGAKNDEFNAFIDVGAFFKAFTNAQVAQAVFKAEKLSKIEAVIFYDEKSNQTRFIKKNNPEQQFELPSTDLAKINDLTKTTLEARFTFYDQRHITGSDIRQHPKAKALLSIGPKVLLREILQGTLRLRQFMANQRARFVTIESVVELLVGKGIKKEKDVTSIENLIILAGTNEDAKQSRENVKLAFAKIDNEIRNYVLVSLTSKILKSISSDEIANKFSPVRSLFVRSTQEKPLKWLTKIEDQPRKQVLDRYLKRKLKILEKSFEAEEIKKLNVKIREDVIGQEDDKGKVTHKSSLLAFLTPKIQSSVSSTEGTELQLEAQTQQEAEQETEIIIEQILANELKGLSNDPLSKTTRVPTLSEIENLVNPREKYRAVEDLTIFDYEKATDLLLDTTEKHLVNAAFETCTFSIEASLIKLFRMRTTFLGANVNEAAAVAYVQYDNGTETLLLLSAEGLNSILNDINNPTAENTAVNFKICLADMSGRYIGPKVGPSYLIKDNLFDIPEWKTKHMDAFFKAHLFNGGINYIFTIPELREQFGKWIRLPEVENAKQVDPLVQRLKFLAVKLKITEKDDVVLSKKSDPFYKVLCEIIKSGRGQYYNLLLNLFPVDRNLEQTAALNAINFDASTNDYIWKHVKRELFKMNFSSSDEPDSEIESDNESETAVPSEKSKETEANRNNSGTPTTSNITEDSTGKNNTAPIKLPVPNPASNGGDNTANRNSAPKKNNNLTGIPEDLDKKSDTTKGPEKVEINNQKINTTTPAGPSDLSKPVNESPIQADINKNIKGSFLSHFNSFKTVEDKQNQSNLGNTGTTNQAPTGTITPLQSGVSPDEYERIKKDGQNNGSSEDREILVVDGESDDSETQTKTNIKPGNVKSNTSSNTNTGNVKSNISSTKAGSQNGSTNTKSNSSIGQMALIGFVTLALLGGVAFSVSKYKQQATGENDFGLTSTTTEL